MLNLSKFKLAYFSHQKEAKLVKSFTIIKGMGGGGVLGCLYVYLGTTSNSFGRLVFIKFDVTIAANFCRNFF